MANEQVFSNRAESYSEGRLGYADGVLDLLLHDILKSNDRIADIGSGTGIFANSLIEYGFDVFCIEPNDDMRAQAKRVFAGNPHFISVAASAEATTLPGESVNVVTAASAFHWFDANKFRMECKRILKPHGIVFTVANARDYNDPFTIRQHEICKRFCMGFTSLRHGIDNSIPKLEAFFGNNINYAAFDFPLVYTKEKLIQRSLSSSYAPEPNTTAYKNYIEGLWAMMEEFAPNSGKIVVPNASVVYWGELS